MKPETDVEVEILLPVHNEAGSIEAVMREIHGEISPKVAMRFVVCEDGSVDQTKSILSKLQNELPMRLIMATERKGYSRAVREGMQASTAPYLLCLDSDGQCDPADFWKFWPERTRSDIILGWRTQRGDVRWRRFFSRGFYLLWRMFYDIPVHDPSCPFMLARRAVIDRLSAKMGAMDEGFWWEFIARAHGEGFSILEVPIRHRSRVAGTTRVYKFLKVPMIGYRHVMALFRIRQQTRQR